MQVPEQGSALISAAQSANLFLESNNTNRLGNWVCSIILQCAEAIQNEDSSLAQQYLWMLNELASSYGNLDQKLASYFLKALFAKVTGSGRRCYDTLVLAAERNHCFESTTTMMLKFQEASPWKTFGHVASNGVILEALDGESKLHIIDISNTFCTQWPTFLEALATRRNGTPRLKLTMVVRPLMGSIVAKELGQRIKKFARLMRVPFEFCTVEDAARLVDMSREELGLVEDEAVVVNCVDALRSVAADKRAAMLRFLSSLRPKLVTIVEEEADFTSNQDNFVSCVEECLRFYGLYLSMLDESFTFTSNEKQMLERPCLWGIVGVLSCKDDEVRECERRERGSQWLERLTQHFSPVVLSHDVVDDVGALLKRHKEGWSLRRAQGGEGGLYLAWKEQSVVWASAWKA